MIDGQVKAIPLQGIVHNETKIGVQDGMCEDLVNLRFKDGSWRASGDGKHVFSISESIGEHTYEQLYIHTNVYRHLLGVERDLDESGAKLDTGALYWIANLNPKEDVASIEEEDFVFEPIAPILLTKVTGDLTITQTGHLITIIDEAEDFDYFVYKLGEEQYIHVNIDVNGKGSDRTIYPFGKAHFNWHSALDNEHVVAPKAVLYSSQSETGKTEYLPRDYVVIAMNELQRRNKLICPVIAIAAIELYDGSYVYASQPVLINPFDQLVTDKEQKVDYLCGTVESVIDIEEDGKITESKIDFEDNGLFFPSTDAANNWLNDEQSNSPISTTLPYRDLNGKYGRYNGVLFDGESSSIVIKTSCNDDGSQKTIIKNNTQYKQVEGYPPVYCRETLRSSDVSAEQMRKIAAFVRGYDIAFSFDNTNILEDNDGIFTSLCIFITKEAPLFETDKSKWEIQQISSGGYNWEHTRNGVATQFLNFAVWSYIPKFIGMEKLEHELMNSNFMLLKRYNKRDINTICTNPIVDLSRIEDEGIIKSINEGTQREILTTESISRVNYIPKVSYEYNGRIHIANYKSYQFSGYPLDLFNLNNHSVQYEEGAYYKGVLKNLSDNHDDTLQWARGQIRYFDKPLRHDDEQTADEAERLGKAVAFVSVTIETDSGKQKVSRYIPFKAKMIFDQQNGDEIVFLEDLDPLLTFPDYRATEMYIEVCYIGNDGHYHYVVQDENNRGLTFKLKPHPYINMAYYLADGLKPISLSKSVFNPESSFRDYDECLFDIPVDINNFELQSNGLKVSKTLNPMYFPVENAYQIGSSEIVAMCSNAIAVGTGQTGAAPLYVFCKDGIYALMVDSSGEMTYTNARVIARDVCNNAKSVTPIDAGVVFTTDRGLMMIAGDQVQEIGQPLEGDISDLTHDNIKPIFDSDKLSGFAGKEEKVPFLEYLKGCIVNYNHNERELMVSNPDYSYTYILDRNGAWSRRDYTADEYVNNYPTSYRVKDGEFYQVDKESDANNGIFLMSNVIKLDSIGFKELHRVVARGYFETEEQEDRYLRILVQGSYDGRKWATLGRNTRQGKFRDIGCLVERTDCRFFRIALAGSITKDTRLDYFELSSKQSQLGTKIR